MALQIFYLDQIFRIVLRLLVLFLEVHGVSQEISMRYLSRKKNWEEDLLRQIVFVDLGELWMIWDFLTTLSHGIIEELVEIIYKRD